MVILIAAVVRFFHVIFTVRLNPLANNLVLDSMVYDRWAKALVWGGEPPATKLMQAPNPLGKRYQRERQAWDIFYDILEKAEQGLIRDDPFALKLKKKAIELIKECEITQRS